MVTAGFDRTATKAELADLTGRVERNFKLLVDEIRLLRADTRHIATTLKSYVGLVAHHDKDIDRLKRHVGLDN